MERETLPALWFSIITLTNTPSFSQRLVCHTAFLVPLCAFFSGNMGVSLMLYMYVSVSLSYRTIHLSIHLSISLSILDNIYISTLLNETKDCMLDLPQTNYTPCLTTIERQQWQIPEDLAEVRLGSWVPKLRKRQSKFSIRRYLN